MSNYWKMQDDCYVIKNGMRIPFDQFSCAKEIYITGKGNGVKSVYQLDNLQFETIHYVEEISGDQYFELIPVQMAGVEEVGYPGSMIMNEDTDQDYTVLNLGQGLLIPNNDPVDLDHIHFNGQFNSSAAYMPWFGQVRNTHAMIAIAITNDDMAYSIRHNGKNHETIIQMRTLASLGKMQKSVSRYTFLQGDYNDLCEVYRNYAIETGLYKTLKEKAIQLPKINDLVQCSFVHKGIKKHISPDSSFFDSDHLENNDLIVPFAYRQSEIEHFHKLGAKRIYLHIDGWGEPGYDNQHPDYLPVCREAGGYKGLNRLIHIMHQWHDLVGLHDQYRDYYFDARTFNPDFALKQKNGKIFEMSRWAGGHQSYLCASQAKSYVKRNFEKLMQHGVQLDCSYLDVFTCNEMDECFNKEHLMSRKQCKEYRLSCFNYVKSKGVLTSSEEMNDWAMSALVFCHYAPYAFMLKSPDSPRCGIPVPLFNLVYHECVIIPWPMDEGKEDYMLYALINGGAPYLDKDGAYPNVDGSFDEIYNANMVHQILRANAVSEFYQQIAFERLIHHEYRDGGKIQSSTFSNGMKVTVDFNTNSYMIE